jgi:nitrite reductase (NADH) large subunit
MRQPSRHAYGLVAPLFEQAKVCANHLAQLRHRHATRGSVTSTKLKVTGIDVFSAGNFTGGPGRDDIVLHDPSGGVYKKLVLEGRTARRRRALRRHGRMAPGTSS